MSKRTAPYRHEDGSTCWTKGCSRGNFFVGQSRVSFTQEDFYSDADDLAYVEALNALQSILAEDAPPAPINPTAAPVSITPLRSGAELNARYTFHNRLNSPYDPANHVGVKNLADTDPSWTKPLGAFWISTIEEGSGDDEGPMSGWDRLWGNRQEAKQNAGEHEHEVKFKDEAKVLVIDSLDDYEALLERYPHYSKIEPDETMAAFRIYGNAFSVFSPEGAVRRGLDWEALAKEHDALMLTKKGFRACGGGDYRQEAAPRSGDISLYSWDFESAIVFHPEAVSVRTLP